MYDSGSESDVAIALAVAGGGSMIATISLPKILNHIPDRSVMLLGTAFMVMGFGLISTGPSFSGVKSEIPSYRHMSVTNH